MPEGDPEGLSREELIREVRLLRVRHDDDLARQLRDAEAELEHRQVIWRGYARLYDQAPVAFVTLDEKGIVQSANRAAAALLRYEQALLPGKPFIVAARPRDLAPFWRHLERCLAEQSTVSSEIELVRSDGEVQAIEIISRVLPDPSTGQRIVPSALVDVEDRAVAERARQQAHGEERRLRARLEAQARAVTAISEAHSELHVHGVGSVLQAIADQARHLVDAGVAALGLGGATDHPFDRWLASGAGFESIAAGASPRRVGLLDRVATGAIVRTAEVHTTAGEPAVGSFLGVPVRHRDRTIGSLYVANKRTAPEFDEDDERSLVLLAEYAALVIEAALATDTEMRERTRLRIILDQLPEAVIVKDASQRLIPNAKALQLGVDPEGRIDPAGNPVRWDVRTPEGAPIAWEDLPLVRAFRERAATEGREVALATHDGRLVPVSMNATPIVDANGEFLGAVAVWREIEQLKRIERLREEWSAVIAHDLRQPLSVIRSWENILRKGALGPIAKHEVRAFEAIARSAARMNQMIDELLDTSLLEAKRLVLHKARVHVEEIARATAASFPADGRKLAVLAEPELPAVDADPARVERVLENLIANALKYGDAGTDVEIAVARGEHVIEVAVKNSGQAPTPAEIDSLFSRFYRAPSAARRGSGLGLGLYISRGLIEAHGGRLSCEPSDGHTIFRFTLPLGDGA